MSGLLLASTVHWGGLKWTATYTTIDLIAASTNALNGALLARRPTITATSPWSGSC